MSLSVPTFSTLGNNIFSGSPRTISKPTGLAVDDLMVMTLAILNSASSNVQVPVGWTLETSSTGADAETRIYYRVATSVDVSGSSYELTNDTGIANVRAAIVRITGADISTVPEGSASAVATAETNPDAAISVAINAPNNLHIAVAAADDSGDNLTAINTTPSRSFSTLTDDTFAQAAYVIVDDLTDVTAITATSTGAISNTAFSFVVIRQQYPNTGTVGLHEPATTFFNTIGQAGGNGTVALFSSSPSFLSVNGIALNVPAWANETRPSLSQSQLNAVGMNGNNRVYMDGSNKVYRDASTRDWTNENRP